MTVPLRLPPERKPPSDSSASTRNRARCNSDDDPPREELTVQPELQLEYLEARTVKERQQTENAASSAMFAATARCPLPDHLPREFEMHGRPIEHGVADPVLPLAHLLVSKYADDLPLYRHAAIYAREGVELERSTLAHWLGATSELLKPLNNALGSM